MSNLVRRARLLEMVGGLLTLAGLVVFVTAPKVGELLLFSRPGNLSLDSAVVVWGAARFTGAVVVVVGLLIFAGAVGHLRGLQQSRQP